MCPEDTGTPWLWLAPTEGCSGCASALQDPCPQLHLPLTPTTLRSAQPQSLLSFMASSVFEFSLPF